MANLFLSNKSFEELIKKLKINDEEKKELISKVLVMDKEERQKFLDVLKEIYLLDLEEAEAIEKIQKNWAMN